MNPKIYHGHIWHSRLSKAKHSFKYSCFFFAIDVTKISEIKNNFLFSINKFSILSIFEKDYLQNLKDLGINEKLKNEINKRKLNITYSSAIVFTIPRFLGYVFNPVNFYYLLDEKQKIQALVCEVRNTFNEKHLYFLSEKLNSSTKGFIEYKFPKEFYVSPFFKVEGDYQVLVLESLENFDVRVNLLKDDVLVFTSRLSGFGKDLNKLRLLQTLFYYPLYIVLVMTRIHFHALILSFCKKLQFINKPFPRSPNTIQFGKTSFVANLRLFGIKIIKYLKI